MRIWRLRNEMRLSLKKRRLLEPQLVKEVKASWISHVLPTNWFLKHFIGGEIKWCIEGGGDEVGEVGIYSMT